MNFLYKAKWIIMVLSAIVWGMTFGVLFAGGSHVSDSQFDSAFGSDYECGKGISDWQERHWHHTFNMFGYNNIALMGYISMGLELYCQGINNRI